MSNPWGIPPAEDEATIRHQFEFLLQHRQVSAFRDFGYAIWCILHNEKSKDEHVTEEEFRRAFYGTEPAKPKRAARAAGSDADVNVVAFRKEGIGRL